MPRVSVLIPTWNRSALLREAIESVLNQTYQDFEIVVVDDGSTDDTAEVARSYARVRYMYQEHAGIPAARNRALAEARGELIAWLDDDDLYAPEKLEKQVAYLDAHPECEIVFCRYVNFASKGACAMTPRQRRMLAASEEAYETYLSGACVRRGLYARWGCYDGKLAYMEDNEWVMRIGAGGADTSHCLPETLYLRRVHDGQITFSHPPVRKMEGYAVLAGAIRAARKRNENHADD